MKNLFSLLAGFIGTVAMTAVIMVAPMMGMPKMSPPEMLASMLKVPSLVGWIMHFMIGGVFAFGYAKFIEAPLGTRAPWLKGIIFGVLAFVFAQVMMALMRMMLPMPEGEMLPMMMGSLFGHIVFGVVTGLAYEKLKN